MHDCHQCSEEEKELINKYIKANYSDKNVRVDCQKCRVAGVAVKYFQISLLDSQGELLEYGECFGFKDGKMVFNEGKEAEGLGNLFINLTI